MTYQISIRSLDDIDDDGYMHPGPYSAFSAEMDLDGFSASGFQDVIVGKFIDVPLEKILELKFTPGVDINFKGAGYIFEELEKDGTFKLRRS